MQTRTEGTAARIAGTTIRVILTIVVLYAMWVALRLSLHAGRMVSQGDTPDSAVSVEARDRKPLSRDAKRARFPLPLYPGAREPEFGEMLFNGKPMFRCDYEVTADAAQVLDYYRNHLASDGWQDTSEDAVRRAAMAEDPEQSGVLDFQNETFLRYYDHMMNTQASFAKPGRHVLVAVKEGKRSWTSTVGIHYIEYSNPEDLSEDLQKMLGIPGQDLYRKGPATFAQTMGSQRAETRIFTGRGSPADLCRAVVNEKLREGWREVDLREKPGKDAGTSAMLMNDKQMMIVHASRDKDAHLSRVITSVMSSR